MSRLGLKARLFRLERHYDKPSHNAVLYYCPDALKNDASMTILKVWQTGHWKKGKNPDSGPLQAFSGRFLLVPSYGTDAEWERAAVKQQHGLLALARSRTDTPV